MLRAYARCEYFLGRLAPIFASQKTEILVYLRVRFRARPWRAASGMLRAYARYEYFLGRLAPIFASQKTEILVYLRVRFRARPWRAASGMGRAAEPLRSNGGGSRNPGQPDPEWSTAEWRGTPVKLLFLRCALFYCTKATGIFFWWKIGVFWLKLLWCRYILKVCLKNTTYSVFLIGKRLQRH